MEKTFYKCFVSFVVFGVAFGLVYVVASVANDSAAICALLCYFSAILCLVKIKCKHKGLISISVFAVTVALAVLGYEMVGYLFSIVLVSCALIGEFFFLFYPENAG